MRSLLVVAVLAWGLLAARTAHAQDTGGSIGGGDFDEPSSSNDYDSSSNSYDYSSSNNDYSSSYGPSNHGGGGAHLSTGELLILFGLVGGLGIWKVTSATKARPVRGTSRSSQVDVTVLRFGIDARVRPYVQSELARIAKTCDTKTPQGLTRTLNEIALMLRRIRDAWVYGGARNEAMGPMREAQATFQGHVATARATFQHETIRAADGKLTTADAPAHTKLTEEGPGLVLVTLIVAAKQELFTVNQIGDGDELRRALEVLCALTANLVVAVEIVWTPSDPDDRMSSVELEARLGDEVFPIQGAMVGKVVCTYCGAPFPKELMTCPHCGAPAREVA